YSRDGDIFLRDTKTGTTKHILQTTDRESNPQFSFNDAKIVYNSNQNLYAWDIATGELLQLTNLQSQAATGNQQVQTPPQTRGGGGFGGNRARTEEVSAAAAQEQWLKNDQLQYFQVLKER